MNRPTEQPPPIAAPPCASPQSQQPAAGSVLLIQRLRSRLVIVPKPGAKPFRPTYPIMGTSTIGGEHKPGDPAGYSTINPTVGACAAGYDPSNWMMLEMVYAVDPLCEEAAAALESANNANAGLLAALEVAEHALRPAAHAFRCPVTRVDCVNNCAPTRCAIAQTY